MSAADMLDKALDAPQRTYWHSVTVDDPTASYDSESDRVEVGDVESANLVGSLTVNGLHAPALDIDYPARLVPSSTPGHFHLYLEREVEWDKYEALLVALADAGLIEPGYASVSIERGQTFLRTGPKPAVADA